MPDLQEIITTLKPYMTESVCLKTILSSASIKEFKNLSRDSRNCGFDTVFTAVKGVNADGHNFISAVLERGCRLVIYDSALPDNNNIHESVFIKVRNSGEAYAVLAELFCGIPGEKLKLLAVTGTNGKTTTAFILRHIIEFHGYSTGLISTVEYSCAKFHFDAERTTPDALVFQRLLKSFTDNDCTHIVMEVSSHALDQYRIGCTKYDVALFTNLTGDHLDYHKTMSEYFRTKSKLFKEHLKEGGIAVINIDDSYGEELFSVLEKAESYGFSENSTFKISEEIRYNISESSIRVDFSIKHKSEKFDISIPLLGKYNIYNAVASFAAAYMLNIPSDEIINALKVIPQVPGRLEQIKTTNGALVFVDYAHTDDALYKVLSELSDISRKRNGRLICLFGCGGDRDKSKRPRMGKAASLFSDSIILTSDNPRTEIPETIIDDIMQGIPSDFRDITVLPDREKAIETGISEAGPKDILLVAGKGHETYQEINGEKHPFDDRRVIRKILSII